MSKPEPEPYPWPGPGPWPDLRTSIRRPIPSKIECWMVDHVIFDNEPLIGKRIREGICRCGCDGCGKKEHVHTPKTRLLNKEGLYDVLTSTLDTLLMFEAAIQRDESLIKNENIKDYIRGRTQNIINIAEVFNDQKLVKDKEEMYISLCMDCYELRNILNLPNSDKTLVLRLVRDIQNTCINYFDVNIYN